jgi:predicted permease
MADLRQTTRFRFWLWLIRLIGVIVPQRLRADWQKEWQAELYYREMQLAEWDRLDWQSRLDLLWRSLGAFWDALRLQPRRLEDEMFQDLRYGVRMLLKTPGFTLIVALTLALGIGANTMVFSFVNALLLRQVAGVTEPQGLVQIGRTYEGRSSFSDISYPDYLDYSEQNTVFSGVAVAQVVEFHLSTEQEADQVTGALVSANYFDVLGVKGARGRLLTAADASQEGAGEVVVISYDLWQRRFSGDPNIINQTLTLNTRPFTVVGVASQDFAGTTVGEAINLWVPITMWRQANPTLAAFVKSLLTERNTTALTSLARLKPGVRVEQAQSEMALIAQRLTQAWPDTYQKVGFRVVAGLGLEPQVREKLSGFALLPLVTVGLMLLIACANIAGLLLARAVARQREFSIRQALGATPLRLIRQMLTESLLLAGLGGLLGLLAARWLGEALRAVLPERYLGIHLAFDLGLDNRVFVFTVVLSLLTGVLFGLLPAWQMSRPDLALALKEKGATGSGAGRIGLRGALVITQVALSLMLLLGAGLCLRTLQKAQLIHTGFDTDRVLTARLDLARQHYTEPAGRAFYRQLLERTAALPGVESASLAVNLPLTGNFVMALYPEISGQTDRLPTYYNIVTPHYFETLNIGLLLGRCFTEQDDERTPRVAMINESLARLVWPNLNPLGQRFTLGRPDGKRPLIEVIGVVRDAKGARLFEAPPATVYLPLNQHYQPSVTLQLRTAGPPEQLTAALRREVSALDNHLPVYEIRPLTAYLRAALTPQRLAAALISSVGILALALASLGLYGVMAYTVAQRTPEVGVRMALGAQAKDVLKLIIGQGLKLVIAGVVLGLGGAITLTRLLKSLLFEVSATDPLTFIAVPLLLLGVALVACYLPARRATRIDPLSALRHE